MTQHDPHSTSRTPHISGPIDSHSAFHTYQKAYCHRVKYKGIWPLLVELHWPKVKTDQILVQFMKYQKIYLWQA